MNNISHWINKKKLRDFLIEQNHLTKEEAEIRLGPFLQQLDEQNPDFLAELHTMIKNG